MTKAWMLLNDIDTYVFMDEAWIVDSTQSGSPPIDIKKVQREGIRNHPDRREVIMLSAENRRGEKLTAKHFILRPEVGKPKLSPLQIDPSTITAKAEWSACSTGRNDEDPANPARPRRSRVRSVGAVASILR